MALVPLAGALVQQRNLLRLLAEQARPQHVGEQVVVAVPLPPVVQRDDEQVGALQGHDHLATVGAAGDGVTQRSGEPVQNRGLQQEAANRVRLVRQHFLDQVVDEVPVVAGEPGDEAARILAPLQGERGELQRGDPPLGPLLQDGDVRRGQIQARHHIEVRIGLVGGESQVRGPDLDQLAAHPPPSQRQVRVGAGAEHDVHVGRQVLQQEGQAGANIVSSRSGGSRRGPATPRAALRRAR